MSNFDNFVGTREVSDTHRFDVPALENWLHRIKLPTQIIWGDTDRLFPAAYGERWRMLIANSKLTILERCGHLPHVEYPLDTAQTIISFLNGAAK